MADETTPFDDLPPPGQEGDELFLAEEVSHEDLQGTFAVKVSVNADAAFDQQRLTQLAQYLVPLLQPIWPLGARAIMQRLWEVNGQRNFEGIYPPQVAALLTQLIVTQEMLKLQALLQPPPPSQDEQPSEPPPGPPPPNPDTVALKDQAEQHRARVGMQRDSLGLVQTQAQTAQAMRKFWQTLFPEGDGR